MNIREKYIRRGIRTASRIYKDKTVVILLSLGNMDRKSYGLAILEDEGTLLWRLLDENRRVKEVVNTIAKFKKISYARIGGRLLAYIKKLAKYHIVDIIDSPSDEYY
jgi:16S rRNA U516 pseudouridylate synthase RsuA-like enzyme